MLFGLSPLSFTVLIVGPVTLLSYFVLSTTLTWIRRQRLMQQHHCKPVPSTSILPGPIGWLLELGTATRLIREGTWFEWCRQRHLDMGITFTSPAITGTVFETCDPEIIKNVLASNFKDFDTGIRKAATGFIFGNSIVNTDGAEWHRSRALLRPSFSRSDVGNFTGLDQHLTRMIDSLPKDGSTVDLQDYFFRFTGDAALQYLVGKQVHTAGSTADDIAAHDFFESYNYILGLIIDPFRDGLFGYLWPSRAYNKKKAEVFAYVDGHVNEAIAARSAADKPGDEASHVLVRALAAQIPNEPLKIRQELLATLNAGRDTTAALLTNMWQVITQRPDIMQRLRAEIAFLQGAPPTYEQLKGIKYLQWVMSESLRLQAVVPVNARFASHDLVLPSGGGPDNAAPLFLPKGAMVLFDIYTMHRRTALFGPDALEFRPDRWADLRPGWGYLPFHGGPRTCIGQQLALTEVGYTTVRLLQAFGTIESRDDQPLQPRFSTTFISRNGAKVALMP